MPGPPPRQHKYERQYTPSTHSVIPTRRIWNDDYDGQMIFGDLGGLKFPDMCLTGEEKARKTLTQETCPDLGSNPGPLRDKRACYHLFHSGGQANMFKEKRLIEKGVPATSTRCPDHLSRQLLTTVSTFPFSSKNSSVEHIHALSSWLILTNRLTHSLT